MIMKKMTYDEYKDLCCQNNEQFSEMFDEFIDMENTADLKYQLDFDDVPGYFGIAARSEDSDVFAVWLPDGSHQHIFYETSISEVLNYLCVHYPEDAEDIRDCFANQHGERRIHSIGFYPSNWDVFTSTGCISYSFEPSCYDNEDEAYDGWVDWCDEHHIDKDSIKKFETEVKIHTSNQVY